MVNAVPGAVAGFTQRKKMNKYFIQPAFALLKPGNSPMHICEGEAIIRQKSLKIHL
jgi:hypothetical protein